MFSTELGVLGALNNSMNEAFHWTDSTDSVLSPVRTLLSLSTVTQGKKSSYRSEIIADNSRLDFSLLCVVSLSLSFVCDPICVSSVPFSRAGVGEPPAETVSGSQPAHQHQRAAGRVHAPPPGLLPQPPAEGGGSGELRSAQHAGPDGQQPHRGTNGSWTPRYRKSLSFRNQLEKLPCFFNTFSQTV